MRLTLVALALLCATPARADVERIVFVRHGEKPAGNFGQLSCRGLNRALALPRVLISRYHKPDYIFAPDPKQLPQSKHRSEFDYVRPLMTIEPTAIRLGMPVNTQFDTETSEALARELLGEKYARAVVFVAWQHNLIAQMARELLKDSDADPAQVPEWRDDDYDSIYVVEIVREEGATKATKTTKAAKATFRLERQGLEGLSDACPDPH
jgi:hypothetical protein